VAKTGIKRLCCDPVSDVATQTSASDGHFLATAHIEHGMLFTRRGTARQTHTVYANQLVNVLELLIAQVDETLINLSVDLLEYRTGDKHATRLRT